jgi:hypothetical protein
VSLFEPRLDILPSPQRRLWTELCEVPANFVLYGGTAIAPHLGHRQSIDFDFFGDRPSDPLELVDGILLQRAEAKDYLDIDALLTTGSLDLSTACPLLRRSTAGVCSKQRARWI